MPLHTLAARTSGGKVDQSGALLAIQQWILTNDIQPSQGNINAWIFEWTNDINPSIISDIFPWLFECLAINISDG